MSSARKRRKRQQTWWKQEESPLFYRVFLVETTGKRSHSVLLLFGKLHRRRGGQKGEPRAQSQRGEEFAGRRHKNCIAPAPPWHEKREESRKKGASIPPLRKDGSIRRKPATTFSYPLRPWLSRVQNFHLLGLASPFPLRPPFFATVGWLRYVRTTGGFCPPVPGPTLLLLLSSFALARKAEEREERKEEGIIAATMEKRGGNAALTMMNFPLFFCPAKVGAPRGEGEG